MPRAIAKAASFFPSNDIPMPSDRGNQGAERATVVVPPCSTYCRYVNKNNGRNKISPSERRTNILQQLSRDGRHHRRLDRAIQFPTVPPIRTKMTALSCEVDRMMAAVFSSYHASSNVHCLFFFNFFFLSRFRPYELRIADCGAVDLFRVARKKAGSTQLFFAYQVLV